MNESRECGRCPAFIWAAESLRTGLCHGCRSPGPELHLDARRWAVDDMTNEWLEVFDADKDSGAELADSVFWRLALHSLPLGVNAADPRVVAALNEIRASVARRGEPKESP